MPEPIARFISSCLSKDLRGRWRSRHRSRVRVRAAARLDHWPRGTVVRLKSRCPGAVVAVHAVVTIGFRSGRGRSELACRASCCVAGLEAFSMSVGWGQVTSSGRRKDRRYTSRKLIEKGLTMDLGMDMWKYYGNHPH